MYFQVQFSSGLAVAYMAQASTPSCTTGPSCNWSGARCNQLWQLAAESHSNVNVHPFSKYRHTEPPSSSGCSYSEDGELGIVKDAWKRNGTLTDSVYKLSPTASILNYLTYYFKLNVQSI